ncbi:DUF3854 domain-containing protein [Pseudanabaena sp. FACHB-1277]|uniref:DUF3854 domain-containing protein n=1 Tax=Pseudanabaena cinerea FACHB-1277 TaxID=2949581 RepID=A0A926UYU6_9CYAN|nr:DUF3854 domain-containing protein [Pseudanabaena cinerea]MBD2152502.1 DUF3854 domain-containing protein [Pseudanabaena cinerea FACHB-1277]
MAKEYFEFSDRYREAKPAPLATNHTLERGKAFLERITRISVKDRAIALSIANQFDLYDYNDYKTSQDGKRRHVYCHSVRYLQETGETWQFIVEAPKTEKGYRYLAPAKIGNRAFFPAIPRDIREAISKRYGVKVPTDGSFWEWLKDHPEIPIFITEGGGKALSGLSHGFVAIAVYGCGLIHSPDLFPYIAGRKVYIALDCDTKPSAVRVVNGSLFKHLPMLSDLASPLGSVDVLSWDSQFKGLDDLLANCGATALEQAINGAISSDKWLDNRKIAIAYERLQANKIKADLTLDRLPTFAELQELHKTHPDIFLDGAKGLGKSERGGEFVRNADYSLLPVPLESLARNNSQRMSQGDRIVDYRTDCDRVNGQLIGGAGYVSRLSFCTEAIHGLKGHIESCLQRGAAVFNDELDLQLNSLATSSTHAQNGKRRINQALYWEMQIRAKQTLSVSADLTKYEAALWERKTGRKPFVIRVETPKKNYKVRVFGDAIALLFRDVKAAIASGERLIICCSRKSEAKFLQWLFRDYGAIAVHRDNANDPIFKGFFDSPNQWLRENNPKILIVSPVLRSGFSITHDAFDKVFCFYHADSISASTALQLSDRYRLPVPRYIYAAQSSGKYNHITPESILKTRKGRARAAGDDEINLIDEYDPYYHYQAADNWSKANFRADIIARLRDEVETVEIDDSKATKEDRAAYKALKDDFEAWQREQKLLSRNLTKAEYEDKKDRRDLSEADLLAVEKYRLANWSDTSPESVTIEQIERDDKGRKRKALERLEKQAFPILAIAADKTSKEVQAKWGAGYSQPDFTHLALAQKALEQIGVHEFLDFALAGNVWGDDTAIAADLASKLREQRNSELTTFTKFGKPKVTKIDKLAEAGIHLSCGKDASNNTYIGALLQWYGLKRDEKRITREKSRVRVYRLCQADLSISRDELSRRAARMIREGLELIPSHAFVERIIDLSTPFVSNTIERCGHPQTETGQTSQSEAVEIPDPPIIEAAIAPSPIAQTNIKEDLQPIAIAQQPITVFDIGKLAIDIRNGLKAVLDGFTLNEARKTVAMFAGQIVDPRYLRVAAIAENDLEPDMRFF